MLAGEAKALHTAKRSSGVDVSDPALADAWNRVRRDSDPQTDWCAFTHAEGSNQVIALLGSGSGGLAELCSALDETKVAFCGLRVTGGGGGGKGDAAGAAAPRFHRIVFVGEEVGGMKRGRAALQKNAVFAVLEGASAGDHAFSSLAELSSSKMFS